MEMAALYYPPAATVVGDAYLNDMPSTNFAYWGRNLVQSNGVANSNSFWGVGGYINGPLAQANMSSTEFTQYKAKVDELSGEATLLNSANTAATKIWNMQGSSLSDSTMADLNNYPNGKIWKTDNLTLTSNGGDSYAYKGNGTIIVTGNLTINSGVKIKPADPSDPNARLGFIVLSATSAGPSYAYIGGNHSIQSPIFKYTSGNNTGIVFNGDNVDMIGSFVSKYFNNLYNGGTIRNNIRFYYDKRLDSGWPPGFRYLNMPHPTEN